MCLALLSQVSLSFLKLQDCLGLVFFSFSSICKCVSLHSLSFMSHRSAKQSPMSLWLPVSHSHFYAIIDSPAPAHALISPQAIIISTFNSVFSTPPHTHTNTLLGSFVVFVSFVLPCGESCLFQQQLAFTILLPSPLSLCLPLRWWPLALETLLVCLEST